MNVSAIAPNPVIAGDDKMRVDFHVVPASGHWAVKAEYAPSYKALFDTQIEAMAYGRQLAMEAATSLIIHGRDGQFRDTWSYS